MENFSNSVVIITGACGGIGESISNTFAEAGPSLGLCDIREHELNQLASSFAKQGVKVHHSAIDITNQDAVRQFCGFLFFEAVVPDEINKRAFKFIEKNGQNPLRQEDWFVQNVFLNPPVAGAVRSLLGTNFALPVGISNHLVECPAPAQNWHRDGGSRHGPAVNNLQVFYYPQDTPLEMGPTEIYPGSHFLFSLQSWMGHYNKIRGQSKLLPLQVRSSSRFTTSGIAVRPQQFTASATC